MNEINKRMNKAKGRDAKRALNFKRDRLKKN